MRQGQQNRRGRGRSNNTNNNRKGQSPLTRSFESTGPDVKIRGTPAHIGEKYVSLARDATVAGDRVLAENYLQHAEHYNRIILAAREQSALQGGDVNGAGRFRNGGSDGMDGGDDYGGDDEFDDYMNEPQPSPRAPDMQPRLSENAPRPDDRPYRRNQDFNNRPPRGDRYGAESRGHGNERPHASERPPISERQPSAERPPMAERPPHRDRQVQPAAAVEQPAETFSPPPRNDAQPRRRERYQPPQNVQNEQPEFLRRPVRRPRREANGVEPEGGAPSEPAVTADESERE